MNIHPLMESHEGIGIYNGAEDTIKFQDNWSSAAMANIMAEFTMGRTLQYAFHHPTLRFHNPRFTKNLVQSLHSIIPKISRRARDKINTLRSKFNEASSRTGETEIDKTSSESSSNERGNIQTQISTQIENAIANVIPSQVDAIRTKLYLDKFLHVHPSQSQTSTVPNKQYQLYLAISKLNLHCNNKS
ncbi:hypothetical protein Tco_1263858 [Tanacetum coccineum]